MINFARELFSSILSVILVLWLFLLGMTAFAVVFALFLWVELIDLVKKIYDDKAKI